MVDEVALWQRQPCPRCKKSSQFYCTKCLVVVGNAPQVTIPALDLPVQIHIMFRDRWFKSTSVHAQLVAPNHVQIYQFPDEIPQYFCAENAVVVYPSPDATCLESLVTTTTTRIDHMIFIDSPWQQAKNITLHESLAHLPRVKLKNPPEYSAFWRYHGAGKGCVSTVEAIRWMLEEYNQVYELGYPSETYFEDMLFFFNLIRQQIERRGIPVDEAVKEQYRQMRFSARDRNQSANCSRT